MKTIQFQDLDRQEVTIQLSSLATEQAYRIYLKGDDKYAYDDGLGNLIHPCLHINRSQAQILLAGLQDLLSLEE